MRAFDFEKQATRLEDLKSYDNSKSQSEIPSLSSITVMNEVAFLHARDGKNSRVPPVKVAHVRAPRIQRDPSSAE